MNQIDFEKKIKFYKELIDKRIELISRGKKPSSLYRPIEFFLESSGKRIRPILMLLSAEACDERKALRIINQAIAIELLHNFTLIHDDIMDNAKLRHGKETLHRKYDVSTAILAGDNLLSMAYKSLTKNLYQNSLLVVNTFTDAVNIVCEGQSLDKEFENRIKVSRDEYFKMIRNKTASLISAACKIAALTIDASKDIVNSLKKFGMNLGTAFQIKDDLLDMTGQSVHFGKKLGSDLVEGKKTFLLISALNNAKDDDLKQLKQLIKNKGIKISEVKKYFNIYRRLGVVEEANKSIQLFTHKAINNLSIIKNSQAKSYLTRYALKLLERSS